MRPPQYNQDTLTGPKGGRIRASSLYLIPMFSTIIHVVLMQTIYVSGVSLTHGQSPRQHIWTFAGALDESSSPANSISKCPCVTPNLHPTPTLPSFIGNDYFCDTAFETTMSYYSVPNYNSIQVSDPLWDGKGCGPTNTCCYDPEREVNPPWFVKTLSSPTSDDIEMRLHSTSTSNTTPIEIVELYVQCTIITIMYNMYNMYNNLFSFLINEVQSWAGLPGGGGGGGGG